jgi:hypothetical protein
MPAASNSTKPILTREQRAQWDADGFLLLRGVIPQATIQSVRGMFARAADKMIAQLKAEGLIADERKDLPFERRFAVVAGAHAHKFGRGCAKRSVSPKLSSFIGRNRSWTSSVSCSARMSLRIPCSMDAQNCQDSS